MKIKLNNGIIANKSNIGFTNYKTNGYYTLENKFVTREFNISLKHKNNKILIGMNQTNDYNHPLNICK